MIRTVQVSLSALTFGRDLRGDTDVSDLVDSMRKVGQLHPVYVKRVKNAFTLWSGNRRAKAAQELGWKTISAVIIDDDMNEYRVELIAIDENLARRDLPTSVQVKEIGRRKEIHDLLHPETKQGAGGRGGKAKMLKTLNEKGCALHNLFEPSDRFTKDTAKVMGVSETKVAQLTVLAVKATDDLLQAIDAGKISKRDAAKIAQLSKSAQRAEVERRTKPSVSDEIDHFIKRIDQLLTTLGTVFLEFRRFLVKHKTAMSGPQRTRLGVAVARSRNAHEEMSMFVRNGGAE